MRPIDVRIIGNKNFLILAGDSCEVYKYKIEFKSGFITDLASIPKVAYSIVGCPSDFPFPSVIHDLLYRSRLVSRKEADYIFFLLLIKDGIPKDVARRMYMAVRAFGDKSYDEAIHTMAHYRNYITVIPV